MTRMMASSSRATAARLGAPIGAVAALLGTLTGCTAAVETERAVDANYRDGSFRASGTYLSPGGYESITVVLELENNIVTDVVVGLKPTNAITGDYQGQFRAGIGDIIIGQNIDSLDVTVVAGSSLTSMGFREAVSAIKAEALDS